MSAEKNSSTDTVMLYVCKICGKVGIRTRPLTTDFGGCARPSNAHIFAELEVVVKPPPAQAKPA